MTYSIALKLFSRKAANPIQLLGWLKQILHYRTQYLKKHESEASQGSSCKISQQMYTMLETVFLLFLRNTNVESVKIAMSCFKYLCLEAELVMSPMEPTAIPYAANIRAYKRLEEASQALQIGRAAQQKKIRAILRELVHSPGSALAWEDTYSSWRVTRANLIAYQREEIAPPDILRATTETLTRNFMKKVNTLTHVQSLATTKGTSEQQLSEDNVQATLLNWTNMTGFLCSLAGVSTKPSTSYSYLLLHSGPSPPPAVSLPDGTDVPHHSPPLLSHHDSFHSSQHLKVKRSRSYHGNRPKSVSSLLPVTRTSTTSVPDNLPVRFSGEGILEDALQQSRTSQTEAFISELMILLYCSNEAVGVNIRETVKELVSYELSPPVYPYLFLCMMEETRKVRTPRDLPEPLEQC